MPRVSALLVDYDGTIAPLGVPREESKIFDDVEAELRLTSKRVPICVVTAKSFDFVRNRCSFASGWACVSGLDIRLKNNKAVPPGPLASLDEALRVARELERLGTYTELKRGQSRKLLAISVDWTSRPSLGKRALARLRRLSREGLTVTHDRGTTFADVYSRRPDKGRAVRLLVRMLQVESYTMFIGDSPLDNDAFHEAGVSIGIAHGQPLGGLECDFILDQTRLAEFLRTLSGRGMDFTPSIAGLRPSGG